MLDRYIKVIEVTYELARKRYDELMNGSGPKPGSAAGRKSGDEDGALPLSAERTLGDFLSCLDIEAIKILQVVMFLGRDRKMMKEVRPERLLADYRKRYCASWQTKEAEIKLLTECYTLDKLLKDGMELLGLWL